MIDLLSRVRRTPDRVLHSLRRRSALETLRARRRPTSVLVLCHGNICRSPLAAALLSRALGPLRINVQSAGFIGFNRPAPDEAVAAAWSHGVDLANHRSRLVTADLIRSTDLIVVMDPAQRRLVSERFGRSATDVVILGDFDPAPVETRMIRDPVNENRDVFDTVYQRIARCVRELVKTLDHSGV